MVDIREDDFVESVFDALQYVSYFHPPDFLQHMSAAYEREENPAAKSAMGQILVNSRMCALGRRPLCQDTGTAHVFVRFGMGARLLSNRSLQELADAAVRRAYLHDANPLRASILHDPFGKRINSGDNTPCIVHVELVEGDTLLVDVSAKGGGSENKSKFAVLEPSQSIVDWVVNTVETLGAGWCPPGVLGIGVGGSAEKAMIMAKQCLNERMDMAELLQRGPSSLIEETRIEIFNRVNALGIGAQGLGGVTTVLDVRLKTFPVHAASLPIALIPNCAATRHVHFELDGSGPARLMPPDISDWPEIVIDQTDGLSKRVNLDGLSDAEVESWKPGQTLLLSGKLLTGRDAAHKRMIDTIRKGESLPVDLKGRAIYYVGPVDAVGDEVIGPAGPTTSTRMDRFTPELLSATGLKVMIGKAERGGAAIEAIKNHKAAYLIAVGGAAYLVSKAVQSARVLAYEDLGMEAIREFVIKDMPVMVAVDATGTSVHQTGPQRYRRAVG